ncbi:hypothetical protein CB0940_03527 [Cercospora beticola]|uniref:CCHC-type domain-containing protein n=1 Tax=Cercospora beticola TaxID=122368 RepID=A0A2G5I5P8_CERBT|nr:hypothetical protein CB0940_03527 [Cercospora beticola]PIB00138.1 hypothetical protein CB0940_03527 [Cercospora beticola]WPB00701.1 hypothetical protein RHO25_005321 [Cercospora beticola]
MGEPLFNEFHAQMLRSLMERLSRAGFPIVTLDSQARQHLVLFNPANDYFYGGKVKTVLEPNNEKFALPDGYHDAYARALEADPEALRPQLTDVKERMMFCKVKGDFTRASATKSKANPALVAKVMQVITEALHPVYGDKMEESVCIVVPWRRQFELYEEKFSNLEDMGHMKDNRRNCVLLTRGIKAIWVLVGEFEKLSYGRLEEEQPREIGTGSVPSAQYNSHASQGDYAYSVDPSSDFDILDSPRDLLIELEREALEQYQSESGEQDEGTTVLAKLSDEAKARILAIIDMQVNRTLAGEQADKDKHMTCNKCNEIGHRPSNCTKERSTANVQCRRCLQYGHYKSDCGPVAYVVEPPELEDNGGWEQVRAVHWKLNLSNFAPPTAVFA